MVHAGRSELLTRLNEKRPIGRLDVTRRKPLAQIDRTANKRVGEKAERAAVVRNA